MIRSISSQLHHACTSILGGLAATLILLGGTRAAEAAREIYFDQFNWGEQSGYPGDLNRSFWSDQNNCVTYRPYEKVSPQMGSASLGLCDSWVSSLFSPDLSTMIPSNDYEIWAHLRMTEFDDNPNAERNMDIAFRSNKDFEGYLLTLDGGGNRIRLRRQGGNYYDICRAARVDIKPGDDFYLHVKVRGHYPVLIQAQVSRDPSFSGDALVFDETVHETAWSKNGNIFMILGFTNGSPYQFDADYVSIGEWGYEHPVEFWSRDYYTNATEPPTISTIGDLDEFEVTEDALILKSRKAAIRLTPRLDGTVQVDFAPNSVFTDKPSWSVTRTEWPDTTFTVEEEPDVLRMIGPQWQIAIERKPLRLNFQRLDGTPLFGESQSVATSANDNLRTLAFDISSDDAIYGLGEQAADMDVRLMRRGHTYRIENHHDGGAQLIFPYWVSRKGYGVFIDNPGMADLDIGAKSPNTIQYHSEAGELRYYVFVSDSMDGVMDQYTQVTGRPLLAPRWSFGNIQSKFGYKSFQEVDDLIGEFDKRDIPVDGVAFDLDWFGKELMGALDFQTTSEWENPVENMQKIHDQGVKVIPIMEPQVTGQSMQTDELIEKGLVGLNAEGEPVDVGMDWVTSKSPVYLLDFTNPETRIWWKNQHERLIRTYGFDAFWHDLNEPEGEIETIAFHGGSHTEVANIVGMQMNRATYEAVREYAPDSRPFIMSRSGFAGMQKYGAGVWSGDVASEWDDLRRQVSLALGMGLAGVPYWNSDVGGYSNGKRTGELYLRWCQFALFSPIYRPHGVGDGLEPWEHGSEVENAVRELIELRYRLVPYYYTLARETYDTGTPFMRPLVMDYPNDPSVWDLDTQFLVGRNLMAAPVTEPNAISVLMYLPSGIWMDWQTGFEYSGLKSIDYPVSNSTFPMLVKTPTIIPLGPEQPRTDEAPLEDVTLRVFLSVRQKEATGKLYEDDGKSMAYQSGGFATTQFSALREGDQLQVRVDPTEGHYDGMPMLRRYEVVVPLEAAPVQIHLNDELLGPLQKQDMYAAAENGWFYDAATRFLYAKGDRSPISSAQVFDIELETENSAPKRLERSLRPLRDLNASEPLLKKISLRKNTVAPNEDNILTITYADAISPYQGRIDLELETPAGESIWKKAYESASSSYLNIPLKLDVPEGAYLIKLQIYLDGQRRNVGTPCVITVTKNRAADVRYGFYTLWDRVAENYEAKAEMFSDLGINAVEYYDYFPAHGNYAPTKKTYYNEPFHDKEIHVEDIQKKIDANRERGILSLAYVAAYSASKSVFQQYPFPMTDRGGEQLVFNGGITTRENAESSGKGYWFHLMAIHPGSRWRHFVMEEFARTISGGDGERDLVNFDGLEIDSYGHSVGHRYFAGGSSYDDTPLNEILAGFVEEARQLVRANGDRGILTYNCVDENGIQEIAPKVDFLFVEVWPSHERTIKGLADMAYRHRGEYDNKRLVLKLYPASMEPARERWPNANLRLVLGAAITGGGTVMVVGEPDERSYAMKALKSLYYPDAVPMLKDNYDTIHNYNQFDAMLFGWNHGPDVENMPVRVDLPDCLVRGFRNADGNVALTLLHLEKNRTWTKVASLPPPLENQEIRLPWTEKNRPIRVLYVTPDHPALAEPREVDWDLTNGELRMMVPVLDVVGAVLIETARTQ